MGAPQHTEASRDPSSNVVAEAQVKIDRANEFILAMRKRISLFQKGERNTPGYNPNDAQLQRALTNFDVDILDPFRLPTMWKKDLEKVELTEPVTAATQLKILESNPTLKKIISDAQRAFTEIDGRVTLNTKIADKAADAIMGKTPGIPYLWNYLRDEGVIWW